MKNINKKIYHIVFIIIIVLFLLFSLKNIYNKYKEDSKDYYSLIEPISNRIGDKVVKLWSLREEWERIGIDNYMPYPDWYEYVYCSKKLSNILNLNYIVNETWIDIFATESDLSDKWTLEKYSKIIEDMGYFCIKNKGSYLRPFNFDDDLTWFYKQDWIYFLTNTNFLIINFWKILLYLLINFVLYYKLLLPIIFKKILWK